MDVRSPDNRTRSRRFLPECDLRLVSSEPTPLVASSGLAATIGTALRCSALRWAGAAARVGRTIRTRRTTIDTEDLATATDTLPRNQIAGRHLYYPSIPGGLVLEVAADWRPFRAGERGRLRCGYGTSAYDWHQEVPIEGTGVPLALVMVIERDATGMTQRLTYAEWCRRHRIRIICGRCREDVDLSGSGECRERRRRAAAAEVRRTGERELERRRQAWAANATGHAPPVLSSAAADAHVLVLHVDTIERARTIALTYEYDFAGVHIVATADDFAVWATAFREPADGSRHPFGTNARREWPIPYLSK